MTELQASAWRVPDGGEEMAQGAGRREVLCRWTRAAGEAGGLNAGVCPGIRG